MKLGILWDLDGTLLDTLTDLKDSVNYALRAHGYPERTLEEIRKFVGNGARNLITLSLPGTPEQEQIQQVLATFQHYYADHAQVKTCPYQGILPVLEQLAQRYPMAIVSNKPDFAVKSLCKTYFGSMYALGEQAGCPRKPAPDMLQNAMAAIGVDTCIYVGDSEVDVTTANNTGVPCLSVLWGFRDEAVLKAAGAQHFCTKPSQLPALLDSLAKNL